MHTHMYQEHYYPNLDDAQREENRLHSGRNPFGIASLDLGFVFSRVGVKMLRQTKNTV